MDDPGKCLAVLAVLTAASWAVTAVAVYLVVVTMPYWVATLALAFFRG